MRWYEQHTDVVLILHIDKVTDTVRNLVAHKQDALKAMLMLLH